jgi:tetratricopeptide (TPR) repeat protein
MDMWMTESNVSPALKSCLPQSHQGYIIFTTRNRQLDVKLASPWLIRIPEMNEETAINMLRISLVQKGILEDHKVVTTLLQQLTFLPLAITQAAAYINQTEISLADYISLLKEQEEETIELLSKDFEDEWRYSETMNPVATTCLISFNQIQKRDSLATEYLSFMACINPRDIPLSLLPPGPSRIRQTDALGILKAYSFVTMQSINRSLNLHRLVHLAIRNWLRSKGSLDQWTIKVGVRLNRIFPSHDHRNRRLWREYLPHAQSILWGKEIPNHWGEQVIMHLQQITGSCLFSDGRYDEAEALFLRILENYEKIRQHHEDTLASVNWEPSTYRFRGRWGEAEKLGVQVMKTEKTVLGPECRGTLASMANLASIYHYQTRLVEAGKLEVQVIEIFKTALGPDHPDTLTIISNLASTYQSQGRWAEAEKLNVQVIGTRKTVLGLEHPSTLISMSNLASMYQHQGRLAEAEKLEIQAIDTSKTVLGPEHPATLTRMGNLALVYAKQGNGRRRKS